MKFNKFICIVLAICMLASVAVLAGCQQQLKDSYTVTYDLKDGSTRKLTVATGYAASDWTPTREGYEFAGWYADSDCANAYDFAKGVFADVTLYASWVEQAKACVVTVEPNYLGARRYRNIVLRDGDVLTAEQMPVIDKIGMEVEGWYTDEACTQRYNFNEKVNSDFTLYANYKFDGATKRYTEDVLADKDYPDYGVKQGDVLFKKGDIIFEDLELEVYCKQSNFDLCVRVSEEVNKLVEEFNNRPGNVYTDEEGNEHFHLKVKPLHTASISEQNRFQLRIQQIPETNNNYKNYILINHLLDVANIDVSYYDRDDWYAIGDSYLYGGLGSIPLGGKVPFLIYNKQLMEQYGGGKLPSNFSELKEVLVNFKQANATKTPLLLNNSWPFREGLSMAAFVQNGAPYYRYDVATKSYVTDWNTEQGKAAALTAADNLYELLGAAGAAGGSFYLQNGAIDRGTKNDWRVIKDVRDGKSLVGVISWYEDYLYQYKDNKQSGTLYETIKLINSDTLGVLPISNMFTDNDDEWSSKIPLNTIGFQIYQGSTSTKTDAEYAACAIFADYVVRHADRFAQYGVIPLNKELADKSIFSQEAIANDETGVIKLLNAVIPDPNDLYTLDGYILGKPLVTEIAGTGSALGYLDNIFALPAKDGIEDIVRIIGDKLRGTFANGGY